VVRRECVGKQSPNGERRGVSGGFLRAGPGDAEGLGGLGPASDRPDLPLGLGLRGRALLPSTCRDQAAHVHQPKRKSLDQDDFAFPQRIPKQAVWRRFDCDFVAPPALRGPWPAAQRPTLRLASDSSLLALPNVPWKARLLK
jgi:hypothetical protein